MSRRRGNRASKRLAILKRAAHERLVQRGEFASEGVNRNPCPTCNGPMKLEPHSNPPIQHWALYCATCKVYRSPAA